jgi:hypothetical protein
MDYVVDIGFLGLSDRYFGDDIGGIGLELTFR